MEEQEGTTWDEMEDNVEEKIEQEVQEKSVERPKKKKERTEAQKKAWEKALATRRKNIADRKTNPKQKKPEPDPETEPEHLDIDAGRYIKKKVPPKPKKNTKESQICIRRVC